MTLCSNITSKIFDSASGAALLRITRATNNEFRTSSKAILNRTQNQGGSTVVLKK